MIVFMPTAAGTILMPTASKPFKPESRRYWLAARAENADAQRCHAERAGRDLNGCTPAPFLSLPLRVSLCERVVQSRGRPSSPLFCGELRAVVFLQRARNGPRTQGKNAELAKQLWDANFAEGLAIAKSAGAKEMWSGRGNIPTIHLMGGTIMGTGAGVEYYDQKREKQVQEASVVVLAAWAAHGDVEGAENLMRPHWVVQV